MRSKLPDSDTFYTKENTYQKFHSLNLSLQQHPTLTQIHLKQWSRAAIPVYTSSHKRIATFLFLVTFLSF